jgi:hypothetical protein
MKTFSLHWGSGVVDERDLAPLRTALKRAPKLRRLLTRLLA